MATVDQDPQFAQYWNTAGVALHFQQSGVSMDSVASWFSTLSPWQKTFEVQSVQAGNPPQAPVMSDAGKQSSDLIGGFDLGDPTLRQQWTDQQQGLSALGLSPDTVITRNGQTLAGGMPEPGAVAGLGRTLGGIRNNQLGNVNNLVGGLNTTTQRLSDSFGAADAQEQGGLGDLKNTLNGLNIPDSQAAQAFADPQAISAQQQAQQLLAAAGMGSLDVQTNPEDLARQKQVADKLWGQTDTQMTAQERFMEEQFRQHEEQDRRAAMDAALRGLAGRGMLGSGGEVGAMLGAQQTTSNNRMLQDLGAQANAEQRAMQALGLYSNLATSMRNASDSVSGGNSDRRLSGATAAGNVAGQQRTQSFNEAYSRGQAADTTANNQARLGFDKATTIDNSTRSTANDVGARAQILSNTTAGNLKTGFDAASGLYATDASLAQDDYTRRRQTIMDLVAAGKMSQAQAEAALASR